jgi:hypothetical protein
MGDLRKRYWLDKRAKLGFKGYPMATVAFYGPDNEFASKVAVGILNQQREVILMERWFSHDHDDVDVRFGAAVIQKILDFIDQQKVQTVVISPGIIGCPHEEGIDYPEGKICPECLYWAHRDRWA